MEPQDNTTVSTPQLEKVQKAPLIVKQDQLYDADKVEYYKRMQDFYNNNAFGYGIQGTQTNYNPRTQQASIDSNLTQAKFNTGTFAASLLLPAAAQAVTPVEIGQGAEAVVSSAPLSARVTKTTLIPRSEMHIRNMVPAALRSTYKGTKDGFKIYTQPKIRILSADKISKATKALENIMRNKGWKKITHPNLDGVGFTNGKYVISDIGEGNIGRDWLGRVRLPDFTIETVPEFRLAIQKNGGSIKSSNL